MKQTIRLTEQDLRNLIQEAINELDWKTGIEVAKRRARNFDNNKKYNNAIEYAKRRFKEQYPLDKHGKYNGEFKNIITTDAGEDPEYDAYLEQEFTPSLTPNGASLKGDFSGHYCDSHTEPEKLGDYIKTFTKNGTKEKFRQYDKFNREFNEFNPKDDSYPLYWGEEVPEHVSAWIHTPKAPEKDDTWKGAEKDLEDYYTGKSNYVKGNGWTTDKLDESIRRAIRKVLR